MAYKYPYGNTEQMNLDWFLNQWEKFKADWAEAEAGIDGSLDAEIAKVEAAMSELYAARDAAAASATAARKSSLDAAAAQVAAGNSKTAAQAAETSARGSQQAAEQSAQEAQASAQGAENSALTASQAANTATQQAAGADAAKGAAEAAQQAAEDAQAAAAQSAGQAGQAATAAADHADNAADSATLAQQAAQDMSDSVEQITTNKNDISDLKESTNDLKTAITQLDDVYVSLDGENQVTPQNIDGMQFTETSITDYGDDFFTEDFLFETGYYININNTVTPPVITHGGSDTYDTYCVPVDSNSKYSFTSARFAALSKGNTIGSEAVGTLQAYATKIETGEASYLFLSYSKSTTTKEIKKYESQTAYTDFVVPYWFNNTKKSVSPKYATVTSALMTNGNTIQIADVKNNLRKGERIVVSGDITSFTNVRLYFMYAHAGSTNYIEVTDRYITIKNSSTSYTAHGLTLSNNFTLEYEYLDDNTAQITLTSNGNSYTHIYPFIRQSVGYPAFSCQIGSLTNVKMTWTCKDLCKNIWVFGDSYVSYSAERWTYYLKAQGYDKNILLDGFPGEGGANARVSFNNLLQFSVPKFAVWCMGMNDGGDSSSAPSADWVSNRDYFLSYCSANNITPIFGTIPTVATVNNEQKNAWIRASGYRYIDFAQAVGAQSDGTWYSGMLAQDGIHPTEQGAKALYARVLLDLPEIMIDDFE